MKIKEIKPYVLKDQLDKPFYFSQWQYDTRKICLVKITLEDGTYGWGEGYGPADLIKAGIDFFTPFITGKNALDHETIWQEMYLRSLDYGRSGVFQAAVSAIDVALWDIKGKIFNQPVGTLLGGIKNEIIHPYATGLYFGEFDNLTQKLADEAAEYKDQGFKLLKMKVGHDIKTDIKHVAAVRKAIGDDMKLMVDANHAYSFKEALQLSRAIEEFDIAWFEEPISPEDYVGYKRLRDKTDIPIAGGECEYLKYGFKRLFDNESIDIAQPDICSTGGLTEAKRIATLAQTYSKDIVPHSWGTWVAISAAIHFVGNLDKNPGRMFSEIPTLEFDRTENALRDEVVIHNLDFKDGVLKVPTTPGLGIEINNDVLEKYLVK